jgi:hypothetical protein
MPNLKTRIALILVVSFLFIATAPAKAEAPKISKQMTLEFIALQNPKQYAKIKMADYSWGHQQYVCLTALWGKESAWNHKADNPNSSAFGIAQMLGETAKHPLTQINNGLRYIKHRYDKPCNAWKFWRSRHWY